MAKSAVRRPKNECGEEFAYEATGERMFNPWQAYGDIDWSDFHAVVKAWQKRIQAWYLNPARTLLDLKQADPILSRPNLDMAATALTLVVIDILAQYLSGSPTSSKRNYIGYCRRRILPHLDMKQLGSRDVPIHEKGKKKGAAQTNDSKWVVKPCEPEEMLYQVFRCSSLHAGGLTPAGRISRDLPDGISARWDEKGCRCVTKSSHGHCGNQWYPALHVHPVKLHEAVQESFDEYCAELLRDEGMKSRFVDKIWSQFGKAVGES